MFAPLYPLHTHVLKILCIPHVLQLYLHPPTVLQVAAHPVELHAPVVVSHDVWVTLQHGQRLYFLCMGQHTILSGSCMTCTINSMLPPGPCFKNPLNEQPLRFSTRATVRQLLIGLPHVMPLHPANHNQPFSTAFEVFHCLLQDVLFNKKR